jgi:integrase
MRGKISKRFVDGLATPAKPLVVFDTELPGFTLKLTAGGRKVYQLRYRLGGRAARLRTYTIGRHGAPWTADQARRQAEALLLQVRQGIDPAQVKADRVAEDRAAMTVEALSAEFLEVYGATKLKPRSLEEYRRAFQTHINPRLGRLRVKDVTHGDVERLHHAMRATPPTANRTAAALSKFFSWAIRGGHRPDNLNPCRGLEKYKEEPRRRYLSPAEILAVGDAIRACEISGEITPWHAALFRCLVLTGMRRDELRTLEWKWVDLDRKVFSLPDSKVGRRDIPITAPVLAVLTSVTRLERNPHVFCGAKPGRPVVNVAKAWKRVLAASGIAHARPHDLRHTAASVGVASGASLPLIGGVLGHRSSKTTERYAHLSDDPVRAVSEEIACRLERNLGTGPAQLLRLKDTRR